MVCSPSPNLPASQYMAPAYMAPGGKVKKVRFQAPRTTSLACLLFTLELAMLSALRNWSRPPWSLSIESLTAVDEDGVTTLSFLSMLPVLSVLSAEVSSPLGVGVGVTVGVEVLVTFWSWGAGVEVTAGSVLLFS